MTDLDWDSKLGYFSDERGWIRDLSVGENWAVTQIFTKQGAIRGNHLHHKTIQITHVVWGELFVVRGNYKPLKRHKLPEETYGPETQFEDMPGEPHAWKAVKDTLCIVITYGPRSGSNYESDTERLKVPLLT